jgi:potassium efflux system protein
MYAAVRVLNEMAQLIAEMLERRGVRSVIRYRERFVAALMSISAVLGFGVWLYYTAILYRVEIPLANAVAATLSAQWTIGTVTLSFGRLLAFVVAVWLAMRMSRLTQIVLNDDVLPQFPLPRGVPNAISMLVNYAIALIGIFVGAGILGIGLSNLALIVGALGVGIGFGLQNIVNNFVSGLILLFERPVQVGDAVQLGSLSGRITRIGFRASYIRTYGGSEVVVPNGDLVSNQLVNWTLSDRRRRLELTVGVAYGSDPERVGEVLLGVLKADPEVLIDPAPMIVFEAFGDSALAFRCYAWIADFDNGLVTTNRLNTAINRALAEAGLEIPFPQRDVHLKSLPPQKGSDTYPTPF